MFGSFNKLQCKFVKVQEKPYKVQTQFTTSASVRAVSYLAQTLMLTLPLPSGPLAFLQCKHRDKEALLYLRRRKKLLAVSFQKRLLLLHPDHYASMDGFFFSLFLC